MEILLFFSLICFFLFLFYFSAFLFIYLLLLFLSMLRFPAYFSSSQASQFPQWPLSSWKLPYLPPTWSCFILYFSLWAVPSFSNFLAHISNRYCTEESTLNHQKSLKVFRPKKIRFLYIQHLHIFSIALWYKI